jgi:hypothetical protein
MMRCLSNVARGAILALALSLLSPDVFAGDAGQIRTASGLTIYLGTIPAEIIRGHPKTHPEAQAHGGPPRGAHARHLMVAIFDAGSGARVENAKVYARVSALGLAGARKALEPMRIADTVTYGNYFDLPDKGRYRIDVEIEWSHGTAKVDFVYEHQREGMK